MIRTGDKIGHIRIDGYLAEGGMGAVYVGFDEKLERPVALKAIRSDRLNARARARFLVEARLLSQLDHPNICRIHGYLEDKRGDFLVLELIRGRTLRQALSASGEIDRASGEIDRSTRLAVAEAIARALEAAHEKGIIHRDLKLDNVMVTEDGTAKVLDFGLARLETEIVEDASGALHGALHGEPLPDLAADASWWIPSQGGGTELGGLVGTPANMSPEQARGENATAASDVYALGLLLQELFTGRRPYAPDLSAHLLLVKAAEGDTLPVENVRDTDLASLLRRLKSLAPEARPTAAAAVERLAWIRGKPRRRRLRLLAAAVAAAFVLGGVKYTLDLRQERQLALEARNEAEQVTGFLVDLFQASDPRKARGEVPDARKLLRRGTERLGKDLQDQPLLRAQLLDTLGGIHTELGLYDEARPLLKEALAIRERLLGRDHLEVAETLARLGKLARLSGQGNPVPLLRRALSIRLARLGPESPEVANLLNSLGTALAAQGRSREAELFLRRSLSLRERLWGERDPLVAQTLHNLSGLAWQSDRIDEALQLQRRALAIREASLPEGDPELTASREALALFLFDQRGPSDEEAMRLLERVLAVHEKVYGPDHPELAQTLFNLGLSWSDLGDDPRARRYLERSLAIYKRTLEPDHPLLLKALSAVADQHRQNGRAAEARSLDQQVLDITGSRLATNPENLPLLGARVRALLGLGRIDEARPIVASLRASGWTDSGFEMLCRKHGLE